MNAASDFVQADRILRIDGLLGADELLAERLEFREAISELFEGELQLRSKTDDLVPADIIGKTCDVSLELGAGVRRTWNVLITNMVVGPKVTRGLQSYRLTLRPSMWLLSQRSDCRIWQDMTSVEVCETLMSEHGLPGPETTGIATSPEAQHYSVQWNESDLAYLTRRLEEDGIFYWFAHEEGRHVLHLASHAAGYTGGEDIRFAHGSTDRNHINRFETSFAYTPGQRTARDWNFQTPGMVPEGGTPSIVSLPKNGSYELFEYPMVGGYGTGRASDAIDNARVERQAKLRMQASEADHRRVEGTSTARTLAAGGRFTPYDVANPANVFDQHVILAIKHDVTDASYETGGDQPDYTNRFLALPADVPATPHRATPRPRIDGTQVAIVAGPEGEEIHPDEYGRIKLWFPWDRRAARDGSDTCWVRVMQNWAGSGWGGQIIPRIGMEVMVTYLDGDPDRPVVTGVVPNSRQKVPYELPEHKTRSTFRTDSHKADGFNELRFEDKAGEEEIRVHAQQDINTIARRDVSEVVLRNKVGLVEGNILNEASGGLLTNAGTGMVFAAGITGLDETASAGMGSQVNKLSQSAKTLRRGKFTQMRQGSMSFQADGDMHLETRKSYTQTALGTTTLSSGESYRLSVGSGMTFDVRRNVMMSSQRTIHINAGDRIKLNVGASSLTLDKDGTIVLKGRNIRIEGSATIAHTAPQIDLN
ncbi:type VI secretion system tip protein VgrG [Tateyamaria omphalii]|uniref:type VI secretion system Vgr family protein n=1 Tax=Tateyamaria omphalii TaxID=299262 RepID=UPI001C995BA5|nr:type VI secretion system tip protein TssI/VgrG [Tateyamaria omphalii]MBY5931494.1 type VI secretion system tip protein VgrG [Tateyamaria omphalii]